MQRELEAERKAKVELEKGTSHEVHQPKVLDDEHNRNLAAQGVYFRLVRFCILNVITVRIDVRREKSFQIRWLI